MLEQPLSETDEYDSDMSCASAYLQITDQEQEDGKNFQNRNMTSQAEQSFKKSHARSTEIKVSQYLINDNFDDVEYQKYEPRNFVLCK